MSGWADEHMSVCVCMCVSVGGWVKGKVRARENKKE
jgi:hypothetical protein